MQMNDHRRRHLLALVHLKAAIASKQNEQDAKARQEFCTAVSGAFRHKYQQDDIWDEEDETELQRVLRYSGRVSGAQDPANPFDRLRMEVHRFRTEASQTIFVREMVNALVGVDLILWRSGTRFTPAFFCRVEHTAAYAMALFGNRWRACPYADCGKWFVPRLPSQRYCCPRHREAHRVARWRERRKGKSKGQ